MSRKAGGTCGTLGHPYRVVSHDVPPWCLGQSPEMSRVVPCPKGQKWPSWSDEGLQSSLTMTPDFSFAGKSEIALALGLARDRGASL